MSDSHDSDIAIDGGQSQLAVSKGKILLVGNGLTSAKVEALLSENAWQVRRSRNAKKH